jgi:hypothetical protein
MISVPAELPARPQQRLSEFRTTQPSWNPAPPTPNLPSRLSRPEPRMQTGGDQLRPLRVSEICADIDPQTGTSGSCRAQFVAAPTPTPASWSAPPLRPRTSNVRIRRFRYRALPCSCFPSFSSFLVGRDTAIRLSAAPAVSGSPGAFADHTATPVARRLPASSFLIRSSDQPFARRLHLDPRRVYACQCVAVGHQQTPRGSSRPFTGPPKGLRIATPFRRLLPVALLLLP